jgi:hypothetical protein
LAKRWTKANGREQFVGGGGRSSQTSWDVLATIYRLARAVPRQWVPNAALYHLYSAMKSLITS